MIAPFLLSLSGQWWHAYVARSSECMGWIGRVKLASGCRMNGLVLVIIIIFAGQSPQILSDWWANCSFIICIVIDIWIEVIFRSRFNFFETRNLLQTQLDQAYSVTRFLRPPQSISLLNQHCGHYKLTITTDPFITTIKLSRKGSSPRTSPFTEYNRNNKTFPWGE